MTQPDPADDLQSRTAFDASPRTEGAWTRRLEDTVQRLAESASPAQWLGTNTQWHGENGISVRVGTTESFFASLDDTFDGLRAQLVLLERSYLDKDDPIAAAAAGRHRAALDAAEGFTAKLRQVSESLTNADRLAFGSAVQRALNTQVPSIVDMEAVYLDAAVRSGRTNSDTARAALAAVQYVDAMQGVLGTQLRDITDQALANDPRAAEEADKTERLSNDLLELNAAAVQLERGNVTISPQHADAIEASIAQAAAGTGTIAAIVAAIAAAVANAQ